MTTARQIGAAGTLARIVVGLAALVGAIGVGVQVTEALLGLVAFPATVLLVLALRGRHAEPLRFDAPGAHLANIGLAMLLVSWQAEAALLFYGSSMLLAALRGIGACELFAVPNLLLRRDDRLGCPLFLPIDAAEAHVTGRELYCAPPRARMHSL